MNIIKEVKGTCKVGSGVVYRKTTISRPKIPLRLVLSFTGGPSILRSLTITGYSEVVLLGDVPDTIEDLVLDHVPAAGNDAIYKNIVKLFPNLKRLVINNAELAYLTELPPNLMRLNLSRNLLTELPPLPQSITSILVNRNRLSNIPADLPEYLEAFCFGDNYIREGSVIYQDIQSVQCDWSSNITFKGDIQTLTISRYWDDVGTTFMGYVGKLTISPSRLTAGIVPDFCEELYLSNAASDIPATTFSGLDNLHRITGSSRYQNVKRAPGTVYSIDRRFDKVAK